MHDFIEDAKIPILFAAMGALFFAGYLAGRQTMRIEATS